MERPTVLADDEKDTKSWTSKKLDILSAVAADPGMSGSDFLVMFAILQHYNPVTKQCNPSQELLAIETGLCVRAIRTHINRLQDRWLYVHRFEANTTNQYIPRFANVEAAQARVRSLKAALRDERTEKQLERNNRAHLLAEFGLPVPTGINAPPPTGTGMPANTSTEHPSATPVLGYEQED